MSQKNTRELQGSYRVSEPISTVSMVKCVQKVYQEEKKMKVEV